MQTGNFQIQYKDPCGLRLDPNNARSHGAAQLAQIEASIKTFGFVNPILIDEQNVVIAGNGRLMAAQKLGLELVPTLRLSGLSDAKIRALAIADNKIAANASWDIELLTTTFEALSGLDIDFDLEVTGFETVEIDLLLHDAVSTKAPDPADVVSDALRKEPPVSQLGDNWALGRHRLLCGNALERDCFAQLMGDEKAHGVFIDPPFNVRINGHVSGKGVARHDEFVMASGELSEAEFTAFLTTNFHHLVTYSLDGAIHYICADWRHLFEFLSAGRSAFGAFLNMCIWNKTNGGMGSFYRSKHELVLVYRSGKLQHRNNVQLGRHGRNRTNVWDYAGANTFRDGRDEDLRMHPTTKPVSMVADAIMDSTRRGDIILDCFAGSGTTIMAAEKTGRTARAMELDPHYVDVAIRRWQSFTGRQAVHLDTALTFEQMAQRHADDAADAAHQRKPTRDQSGDAHDHG